MARARRQKVWLRNNQKVWLRRNQKVWLRNNQKVWLRRKQKVWLLNKQKVWLRLRQQGALYYKAPPCPGQALNLRHSYLPIYLPTPPGSDMWVDRSTDPDGEIAITGCEIVI